MRQCSLILSLGLLFSSAQPARADFVSQVLSDNPVGFWLLNDAAGTAVNSVSAFNGTYGTGVTPRGTAGPSWVPGPGLVADFNGGNIGFPNPLNLGANGFTIEAWINPTLASLQNTSRIVASGHGLEGYGFGTAAGAELVFTSFAQHDYRTTTLTLLPDHWYYVGVVVDASNDANFYVNGAFVETVAGTLPTNPPALNFTIGSRSPSINPADEFFTGGVAGVSVYSRALDAATILAQYNAALAPVPEPSSLILLGLTAAGAAGWRWRKRRAA